MSLGLLIVTLTISALFGSLLIVFAIRKALFQHYKKQLYHLERAKNEVNGMPIVSELTKIEAILKNEKLEAKYNEWYGVYNKLKKKNIPQIGDMLLEADLFMSKRDYPNLIFKMAKIELEIYYAKTKAEITLKRIREITASEEKYRHLITIFKAKYREQVSLYQKTKLDYHDVGKSIELQFENIEKRFKKFEKYMDQNDYDEVAIIVKSLDEVLCHLTKIIAEVPNINMMARNIIPKKINELNTTYLRMIKDNYNLDFLKFNYNINEIEKRLSDILDRARILNINESTLELDTISNYLDELYSRLEVEKNVRNDFEESLKIFGDKHKNLKELIKNIYIALEEIKYNYDIEPGETDLIDNLNKDLESINEEVLNLKHSAKLKEDSYTNLDQALGIVFKKLHHLSDNLNDIYNSLNDMKDDEVRAREQLEEIKYLFRQSKFKLRSYKLPEIKQIYYTETRETEESIDEITKVLNSKPMKIDILNTRVDTARDLVFKLYNNTNQMLKTAMMAEMAIVYGNRYRSHVPLLNEGLDYAETLFKSGNYHEALDTSINTIEKVEPGIYELLLKLYKEAK